MFAVSEALSTFRVLHDQFGGFNSVCSGIAGHAPGCRATSCRTTGKYFQSGSA